jgi:hypothetical protein
MKVVAGKIIAIEGSTQLPDGTQGYTTQTIKYTIIATVPDVSWPVEFANQVPEIRLWPDDQFIDGDRLLNKSCIGVMVDNNIRWHFFEPPAVGGCAVEPPLPLIVEQRIREDEIIRAAEAVGGAPSGGGTQTGGPGGVE